MQLRSPWLRRNESRSPRCSHRRVTKSRNRFPSLQRGQGGVTPRQVNTPRVWPSVKLLRRLDPCRGGVRCASLRTVETARMPTPPTSLSPQGRAARTNGVLRHSAANPVSRESETRQRATSSGRPNPATSKSPPPSLPTGRPNRTCCVERCALHGSVPSVSACWAIIVRTSRSTERLLRPNRLTMANRQWGKQCLSVTTSARLRNSSRRTAIALLLGSDAERRQCARLASAWLWSMTGQYRMSRPRSLQSRIDMRITFVGSAPPFRVAVSYGEQSDDQSQDRPSLQCFVWQWAGRTTPFSMCCGWTQR